MSFGRVAGLTAVVFLTISLLLVVIRYIQYRDAEPYRSAIVQFKQGDFEAALPEIRRWAGKGDTTATYLVALSYARALGVPQDNEAAMAWIAKCKECNFGEMKFELAREFLRPGSSYNAELGTWWLQASAKDDNERAKDALAAGTITVDGKQTHLATMTKSTK